MPLLCIDVQFPYLYRGIGSNQNLVGQTEILQLEAMLLDTLLQSTKKLDRQMPTQPTQPTQLLRPCYTTLYLAVHTIFCQGFLSLSFILLKCTIEIDSRISINVRTASEFCLPFLLFEAYFLSNTGNCVNNFLNAWKLNEFVSCKGGNHFQKNQQQMSNIQISKSKYDFLNKWAQLKYLRANSYVFEMQSKLFISKFVGLAAAADSCAPYAPDV